VKRHRCGDQLELESQGDREGRDENRSGFQGNNREEYRTSVDN
jgi:hypothetical protein